MNTPAFPRPRRPAQGAFTLIELLTVIAIIALLAAIIIAAITSAKNRARQSHSLSNLKMLGQGFLIYANDHQGRLPKHNQSDGLGAPFIMPFWSQQLSPYIGAVTPGLTAFNGSRYELSATMVDPTLGADEHHPYGDYGSNTVFIVRGPQAALYNSIVNPARTVSVMTAQEVSGGRSVGSWYVEAAAYVVRPTTFSNFQPSARASGSVLAAFFDGSVRAIPQSDFHENRRAYLMNP